MLAVLEPGYCGSEHALRRRPFPSQQFEAQVAQDGQFAIELAVGLFRRKGIEQVGQLYAATHDGICRLDTQLFRHKQAIVSMTDFSFRTRGGGG